MLLLPCWCANHSHPAPALTQIRLPSSIRKKPPSTFIGSSPVGAGPLLHYCCSFLIAAPPLSFLIAALSLSPLHQLFTLSLFLPLPLLSTMSSYKQQEYEKGSVVSKKRQAARTTQTILHHAPTGNVVNSTKVADTIAHIKAGSNHTVKGACHLLPSDVRDLRDHCLNSNDPYLFCIWVMLLLAIDLFLRKMEFQSLHEQTSTPQCWCFRATSPVKKTLSQ